jgi:hypothetical protein
MTAEIPGVDRCPKCGAAVRYGDPWCTLCYTDLRPSAPPAPPAPSVPAVPPLPSAPPVPPGVPPEAIAPVVGASSEPLPPASGGEPVAGPSWPCTTCGAVNPMASDVCAACGMPFLSGLRGQEAPLLELPGVGDITRLARGQRLALAGGVVLAFVLLTVIVGLIFH